MNTSDLLEQLLQAGKGSISQRGGSGASSQDPFGGLGGLLGGGAPTGGATQHRSSGGTSYAALASLGMMAFQAYQAWQRSQASAPQQPPRIGAGRRRPQPCRAACLDCGGEGRWPH